MMTFGDKMRLMRARGRITQRARKSITQIELCFLSGVSFSYLQAAELGKRDLTPDEEDKVRICLDWPESGDEVLEQFVAIGYPK